MEKLRSRGKMLLYGASGIGVNMLNLMMGSYLCSALLIGGFKGDGIKFQTFEQKDLVVAAVWAVFVLIAKVIDGIIDIPMASFADNLKTKLGRRKSGILIGFVPMIISYLLFLLVPDKSGATILNTVYYGLILCVFYSTYTLTMVTYYATFTEIVDNERDRNFISNVKSVCDIFYFIIGYVLVSMMLKGMNIKTVALIVLPMALSMMIPMFLCKENPENDTEKTETVNLVKSFVYTFKNKDYILWMIVYSFMTFSVQLFLGGINEYFSYTEISMMVVMSCSFAPVPLSLVLYNLITRKKGFGFSFRYSLIMFGIGMLSMFGASFMEGAFKTVFAIISGLICSLAIGQFFSVAYSVPAYLAAEDEKRTRISHSAMYFAVQGLFAGVASGIGTGIVLTMLKQTEGAMTYMTLICAVVMVIAFGVSFILPKGLTHLGKETK